MRLFRTRRTAESGSGVDCQDFVELVTDYLEGALEPERAQAAAAHLALCAPCIAYLAQLRLTIDQLGALPAGALSPAARGHLLTAFQEWSAGGA